MSANRIVGPRLGRIRQFAPVARRGIIFRSTTRRLHDPAYRQTGEPYHLSRLNCLYPRTAG